MTTNPTKHDWSTFRRAFLWTLAAFAVLWSLRADAASGDEPPMPAPGVENMNPMHQSAPDWSTQSPAPADEAASLSNNSEIVADGSVTHFPADNWTVTIIPRSTNGNDVAAARYNAVYASIPFRREEYLANPGYRHEATMEILFGQLRPVTKVSNYSPQTIPLPKYSPYKPYRATETDLFHQWRPQLLAPYSWNFPITPYYPSLPMLY